MDVRKKVVSDISDSRFRPIQSIHEDYAAHTARSSTIAEEPSTEQLLYRSEHNYWDADPRNRTASPRGEVFFFEPDSPRAISYSPCFSSCHSDISTTQLHTSPRVNLQHTTHRQKNKHLSYNGSDMGSSEVLSQDRSANKVRFSDMAMESVREVRMYVDPLRHNLGRRASLCERILGIVPGSFSTLHSSDASVTNGSYDDDQRILVLGLIPGGEAINCGVKIGDWLMSICGLEVDFTSVDAVLSSVTAPQEVTVTLQKVTMQPPNPAYLVPNGCSPSGDVGPLVQLVSGERVDEEAVSLQGLPHALLYLTLDTSPDSMQDKEDILYQFPSEGDSRLIDIRGAFITLSHMMIDVSNNCAKSCSLVVHNQLVHAGYCKENRELLILLAPATKVCLLQVTSLLKKLVRILKVLYGSLHSAFFPRENHFLLDHFSALVMQRHLLADELLQHRARQSEMMEPLFDVLPACRTLTLPEETKVLISNCLSELESADFVEMSEDYFDLRRKYVIHGSCLFYKGYLLASHLHTEDLQDISAYLHLHCLLTLCHEEQLGQLLVWREIFPTRRCHQQVDPLLPGYTESEARWFILVIGLKNALLGVLLEAGGCAAWVEGNPGPDPFYVDQTKATLLQLEALDAFAQCELRLQGPPVPSLACADWFMPHSKYGKGEESSSVVNFVSSLVKGQTSPKITTGSPMKKTESILKKRNFPSPRGRLNEFESDGESGSIANSEGSWQDRRGRRLSFGSDDSLDGSNSSLFRAGRRRRNLLSVMDVSDTRHGISNQGSTEGSFVKLTSGCDNTLFHYVSFDMMEGIFVCPTQQELLQNTSSLHNKLLYNFHQSCLSIHAHFDRCSRIKKLKEAGSTGRFGLNDCMCDVYEQGVMFQCVPDNWDEGKKSPPVLTYWVVGRCLMEPEYREFYACFHDSAPQNVSEMAFKLGFGVTF